MSEKNLKSLKFHGLDDIYKIPSTAEDVGAATPDEVNSAKTDAVDEAKSYTDEQVKKAAPRNLLDNSDFRNPVNQRGKSSYSGASERVNMIDRWHTWSSSFGLTVKTGHIEITNQSATNENVRMAQYFQLDTGVKVTFAGCDTDGNIECATVTVGSTKKVENNTWSIAVDSEDSYPAIRIYPKPGKTAKLVWVALYKGEYTKDTLPEYQSKGYSAELAECQRYYCNSWLGTTSSPQHTQHQMLATAYQSNMADCPIFFPVPMRIKAPTITLSPTNGQEEIRIYNGGYQSVESVTFERRLSCYGVYARVKKASSDTTVWNSGDTYQLHAHWEAAAEI